MRLAKKMILIWVMSLVYFGVVACTTAHTTTATTTQTPTTVMTTISSTNGTTLMTTEGEQMLREDDQSIIFDNGIISFSLAKASGSITSLIDIHTGRDYIENSAGGNFSVLVDTSTDNAFRTNPRGNDTFLVSSRSLSPAITIKTSQNHFEFQLLYQLGEVGSRDFSDITVRSSIFVEKFGSELTFDYEIDNQKDDSVVISLTGPILSGIKDENRTLDLFWPNKEGKIYDDVVPKAQTTLKLSEQYPSPFSMQIVQLIDDESALYYYVADNQRSYKEFKFGAFTGVKEHDQGTVKIADKISLSCTQFPFVESGDNKLISRTTIGIAQQGGWYHGADVYRDFLIAANMTRTYNDYVQYWTGFVSDTIAHWGDRIQKTYSGSNASDQVISDFDHTGIDTIVLFGWHQGGFDYKYPDYQLFEGEGFGFDNFKAMVDRAHDNGDKVLPYLNAHIIAINSEWGSEVLEATTGKTNMLNSAIKKAGYHADLQLTQYGSYMYHETYGTDTGYYAACPFEDNFVTQIQRVVSVLAEAGVNGLWMDQMMEMPAYLCFDESHGHQTPATAYGEGYKKMYEAIDHEFQIRDIEYLIFAEGVTDAWIEYIDIPGYMWARHLYAPDNVHPGDSQPMAPHITLYTMPATFLGIRGYQVAYPHAYSFLFGSPLASGTSLKDISVTMLYIENADIYMEGRYLHQRGLQISDARILGSIIQASGDDLGVQLYNNGTEEITFVIQINFEELGIESQSTRVFDLFAMVEMSINQNQIVLTLAPSEMAALRVSYGE